MASSADFRGFAIRPDALVGFKGRVHKVRRVLTSERILLEDLTNGRSEVAFLDQIVHASQIVEEGVPAESGASPRKNLEILGYPKSEIDKAERRFDFISPLLAMKRRKRADVEAVAKVAGKSTVTIYSWIKYFEGGGLAALTDETRGPKSGGKLDLRVEEIIRDTIDTLYLDSQQLVPAEIITTVGERCEAENKPVPHENTIRNRIAALPRDVVSRRRGHPEDADRNLPTPGTFPAPVGPLNPVQMDHVRLDMMAVYSDTRQPWGRPWLTLLICVKTRMIVGFYLSMRAPSSVAAGMAIVMGMLPKKAYLGSLGISGHWPVQGKILKLHCDNAKEFRGETLRFGCKEHGIDLELRPVKQPRYGAHIERMVGNVNAMLRKKPGTTFANPAQRGTYDPRKKSVYTLWELEVEIADWIVNYYHVDKHRILTMPPRNAWENEIMGTATARGAGLPVQISDPEKLKLDFLPFEMRVVSPSGVRFGKSDYYHESLNRWVNAPDVDHATAKRKFVIKYHPNYPRIVWFLDPDIKQYVKLNRWPLEEAEDDELDRISVDELMAIDSRDHAQGKQMEDKEAKRGYRDRSAKRQEQASAATKRARSGRKPATPSAPSKPDRSRIEQQMDPQTVAVDTASNPFAAFAGTKIQPFNASEP